MKMSRPNQRHRLHQTRRVAPQQPKRGDSHRRRGSTRPNNIETRQSHRYRPRHQTRHRPLPLAAHLRRHNMRPKRGNRSRRGDSVSCPRPIRSGQITSRRRDDKRSSPPISTHNSTNADDNRERRSRSSRPNNHEKPRRLTRRLNNSPGQRHVRDQAKRSVGAQNRNLIKSTRPIRRRRVSTARPKRGGDRTSSRTPSNHLGNSPYPRNLKNSPE